MHPMLRATLTALCLLGGAARAAGPATFTYSGFLTDAAGNPVASASTLTFSLYAAPTGGVTLFSEQISVVPGIDGYFSAVVGATTTLPDAVFDAPRYLGITYGSEAEMTPRVALTSVPSAFEARSVSWSGVTNRPNSDCTGATPFVTGVGADGIAKCAATPSGGVTACSAGELLKWNGTGWGCAADVDTNTTYVAGSRLALSGNTFSLAPCAAGEFLRMDAGGTAWECAPDASGTVTSVGATVNRGLAVSGTATTAPTLGLQDCGNGQVLRYDTATATWSCANAYGVTTTSPLGAVSTATGAQLSIQRASDATDGFVAATDFARFAAKPDLAGSGNANTAARSDHGHGSRLQVMADGFRPFGGTPVPVTPVASGAVEVLGAQLGPDQGVGFVVMLPFAPSTATVRWVVHNPNASPITFTVSLTSNGVAAGAQPSTCRWGGGTPTVTVGAQQTAVVTDTLSLSQLRVCNPSSTPLAAGDLLWLGISSWIGSPVFNVLSAEVVL